MTPKLSHVCESWQILTDDGMLPYCGACGKYAVASPLVALDLFAGTGWGVACKWLGIHEYAVEFMREANAVRKANGLSEVWEEDVWDAFGRPRPAYNLLIASPPCQTFSVAGGGAGRRALDEVLYLIKSRMYLDIPALREFGRTHDDKTSLILAPLALIYRDLPTYVVLEQVPTVWPVWEAYKDELELLGYSVWTGNLRAEQYGVPQNRIRAVLIARRDGGVAAPPTPTHSQFYNQNPTKLDEGVLPWVTMAEALDWDPENLPEYDSRGWLVGNQVPNRRKTDDYQKRSLDQPAMTITSQASEYQWTEDGKRVLRSNYGSSGDPDARAIRTMDQPATTITSKVPFWAAERPSTSVMGRDMIATPGANKNRFNNSTKGRSDGIRMTVEEASLLQSYPRGFNWDVEVDGKEITRGNKHLQVGNAVPPLLAKAILQSLVSPSQ